MEYYKTKKEFFSELNKVAIYEYSICSKTIREICNKIPDKWLKDRNSAVFIMQLAKRNVVEYAMCGYNKTLSQNDTFKDKNKIINLVVTLLNKYHCIAWQISQCIPEDIRHNKDFIKMLIAKTDGYTQNVYDYVIEDHYLTNNYPIQDDEELVELLIKHRVYKCFEPKNPINLRYDSVLLDNYFKQEYGLEPDETNIGDKLFTYLLQNPWNGDIPDMFIKNHMTKELSYKIATRLIKRIDLIPRKYKNDKEIAENIIRNTVYSDVDLLFDPKTRIASFRLPKTVLKDKHTLITAIQNGLSSIFIPEIWRNDHQIGIECAIHSDIHYLSEEIRNDMQIARIAISHNWESIEYLTPSLQTNAELFELMIIRGQAYSNRTNQNSRKPNAYKFINLNIAVRNMAASLTDKEKAIEYMHIFPWMYRELSAKLKHDPEIFDYALSHCSIYTLSVVLTKKQKNTKNIAYRYLLADANETSFRNSEKWDLITKTFKDNPIRYDVNKINELVENGVCDKSYNAFTRFISPKIYTNPKFLEKSAQLINPYWNSVPKKLADAICKYCKKQEV